MSRRKRNNLGTGIQWSHSVYRRESTYMVLQNKETGGYFRVKRMAGASNPPDLSYLHEDENFPASKENNKCPYLSTVTNTCSLWNSGFKHCCTFKCLYKSTTLQRAKASCSKCAYYSDSCSHPNCSGHKTRTNAAKYCYYYLSADENAAEFFKARIRFYQTNSHNNSLINEGRKVVFYYSWISPTRNSCPVDRATMRKTGVIMLQKNGQLTRVRCFTCQICGRAFLIRGQNDHIPNECVLKEIAIT